MDSGKVELIAEWILKRRDDYQASVSAAFPSPSSGSPPCDSSALPTIRHLLRAAGRELA